MAGPFYVDAANGNDGAAGTSGAPWKTLGKVFATLAAGEIAYGFGTETLTTAATSQANSGTQGSYIQCIACNSSWTPTIGGWTIDANNSATNCILGTTLKHYWKFKGLEFKNAKNGTGSNVKASAANYNYGWIFEDCINRNAGLHGYDGSGTDGASWQFIRGKVFSNSGCGFTGLIAFTCDGVEVYSNGNVPFDIGSGNCLIINCIIYNGATLNGIYLATGGVRLVNNIIDGFATGVLTSTSTTTSGIPSIIGNTITNCTSYGIRNGSSSQGVYEDCNYFYNNGTDISANGGLVLSGGHSLLAQVSSPYNNRDGGDFSRVPGQGLTRTAIAFASGNTTRYAHAGFEMGDQCPAVANVLTGSGTWYKNEALQTPSYTAPASGGGSPVIGSPIVRKA